jgi:hypothetical protein
VDAADASTSSWKQRLRQAVDDDLLEVRYKVIDGIDFLLVHRPGGREEAIKRFIEAMRGPDMPPFEIGTLEAGTALEEFDERRSYVEV